MMVIGEGGRRGWETTIRAISGEYHAGHLERKGKEDTRLAGVAWCVCVWDIAHIQVIGTDQTTRPSHLTSPHLSKRLRYITL